MNQYFQYSELCYMDHIPEVLYVERVKITSWPSGAQSWLYQLKNANDELINYRGSTWIKQSLIRRHCTPSRFDFYTLKDQLLKGIVDEADLL